MLAKIAEMPEPDGTNGRAARCPHHGDSAGPLTEELVRDARDAKDGDVVCFFLGAAKFKARYATLGFSDRAHLDEGAMWPSSLRSRS